MLPTTFAAWTTYINEVNAGTRAAPSLNDLAQIARNMSVDVPGATGPTLLYSGDMGDTPAWIAAQSLERQHPSVRIVDRTEAI
jgi:hypothetical protein